MGGLQQQLLMVCLLCCLARATAAVPPPAAPLAADDPPKHTESLFWSPHAANSATMYPWEERVAQIPNGECIAAEENPDAGLGRTPEPPAMGYEMCRDRQQQLQQYVATLPPHVQRAMRGEHQTYALLDTMSVPQRAGYNMGAEALAQTKGSFKASVNDRNLKSMNTRVHSGNCRGIYSQDAFAHVASAVQNFPELQDLNTGSVADIPASNTSVLGHGAMMMQVVEFYAPEAQVAAFRINPGPQAGTHPTHISVMSGAVQRTLKWAVTNAELFNLSVVSVGTYCENKLSMPLVPLQQQLQQLHEMGIPVIFTAGPNSGSTDFEPTCNCWPGSAMVQTHGTTLCPDPKLMHWGKCNFQLSPWLHECALLTSLANSMFTSEFIMMKGAIQATGYNWKLCGGNLKDAIMKMFSLTGTSKTVKNYPGQFHVVHVLPALQFVMQKKQC